MKIRRVVVTGIGCISPLGSNVKSSWDALISKKSGITKITKFNVDLLQSKIAGSIKKDDFMPDIFIDARKLRTMDLFMQYGIIAATEAIEDSGWHPKDELSLDKTGVVLGSGVGGLQAIEQASINFHKFNNIKVNPFFIPSSLINLLAGHISIKYGFLGPTHAVSTACASGAHSIGEAMRMIQYGTVNVMVAGAAEAPITEIGVGGFTSLRALSTKYNDNPEIASRPWDRNRDGFVMSEGAAVVVLEEYEHAKRRGAKIYAELVGYGSASDGYHITSPDPKGRGGYMSMSQALVDAGITECQISYINAHGTSTNIGDEIELLAVQQLFLDTNPKIMMSSTKSSTGHLLGAAGSLEFIFSILALRDQVVPATLNLDEPIENVHIDLVPLEPKSAKLNYVLSNSFGFGGTNASLILKKYS
jgi:3-oxoacyl-[acyl-carrier-protein] synthase II